MRRILFALAAGLGIFGATPAFAGDSCCHYKQVVVTEYVTVYETQTVSYTKEITRYDHCGKPYTVCVTFYKDIQVPVQKAVTVTRWVKVCY
jgi:hypothetical protein